MYGNVWKCVDVCENVWKCMDMYGKADDDGDPGKAADDHDAAADGDARGTIKNKVAP